MIHRVQRRQASGFTLIEVLIATGLVGVVLALALKGFTEANKIADMTKSKVISKDEAALGIEKMARVIRRCHIAYFDARPIPDHGTAAGSGNTNGTNFAGTKFDGTTGVTTIGNTELGTPEAGIPATLRLQPDSADPIQVAFAPGTARFGPLLALNRNRHDFRFMTGSAAGFLPLRTADASLIADTNVSTMDKQFAAPLFYGAEATFNTSNTGANATQVDPSLPVTWTFYVIYLAPMSFDPTADQGHALFPVGRDNLNSPNGARDAGRGHNGNPFARTTVPLELRMLTVPDVLAVKEAVSKPGSNTATRFLGRNLISATDGVKAFPHDVGPGDVNYDPVPLAIDRPEELSRTIAEYAPSAGSGARVNGRAHGNFNNIGNDPPAEACFAAGERRHWQGIEPGTPPDASQAFKTTVPVADPITDTLIARYIDPDNPAGTFCRFAVDEQWRGINHERRAYVNAYGGPQRMRAQLLADPPATGLRAATLNAPPKRALISVSTRFRSSSAIPFSFATESVEVDLEALARYQANDRRSN